MAIQGSISAPGFDGAVPAAYPTTTTVVPTPVAVPAQPDTQCRPPSVTLIGAGGCGINVTRAIINNRVLSALLDEHIWIDTSYANVRPGETVHIIANGDGGGKVQTLNLDDIQKNFAQFRDLPDTDIYIVVFGLSGASGSVLGTVALRDLARRGKVVVAVMISDSTSQIDSTNTLKTLKSIAAASRNFYLPTIFTSNDDSTRSASDLYVRQQIANLIMITKYPTVEVDRNDRLTWLQPDRAVQVDTGIHMLYVDSNDVSIPASSGLMDDTKITDSVLALGLQSPTGDSTFIDNIGKHARFKKLGLLDASVDTDSPLTGVITNGSAPVDETIARIEAAQALFASQSKKVNSKLKVSDDELGDHGFAF